MNEYAKKPLTVIILALSIVATIWLFYLIGGHSLIKSVYYEESFGFLNKLMVNKDNYDLEYYYYRTELFLKWCSVLFLLSVFFSLPVIYLIMIWKKTDTKARSSKLYFGIALGLFFWFLLSILFFQPASYRFSTDYWEHSAVIKEWSSNLWNPGNPHLAIEARSHRFMPFYFFMAVIANIFSLNAIQAMGIAGILNIILLLFSIFLFFKIYFQDNWAPIFGLIILISFWGTPKPWSSLYQLRSLFFIVTYPSTFALALAFLFLWLGIKIIRKQTSSIWAIILLGALFFLTFLSHPLTSLFAACSFFILILFEPEISLGTRLKLILAIFLGILMTELWPYFSIRELLINVIAKQKSWKWTLMDNIFYSPKQIFMILGPAFLGILVILYLIYKRKHLFIVAGFIAMLIPYMMNIVFPFQTGYRFLFYIVFFLHLAITWAILQSKSHLQSFSLLSIFPKIRVGILCTLLAFSFGWSITLSALEFAGYHYYLSLRPPERYSDFYPIISDYQKISQFIPKEAVVLASAELSWPLPTFSGKVVVFKHGNLFIPDKKSRLIDTLRFFSEKTTLEEKIEIINRYDVTHVLYEKPKTPQVVIKALDKIGDITGEVKNFRVIKLSSDL